MCFVLLYTTKLRFTYNTSNPLRFFSVIIRLVTTTFVLLYTTKLRFTYNTSNPLRFFSVIIRLVTTTFVLLYTTKLRFPYNTSNPLRFFSVIIRSPNIGIQLFLCKHKKLYAYIWLVVYNKKDRYFVTVLISSNELLFIN